VSFALITLTQLALVVVRAEHTQLAPFETPYGRFSLIPPGYSPAMRALFKWLYGFFAVVGPGFFALLLYCGALAFTWRARGKRIRGRSLRGNVECPRLPVGPALRAHSGSRGRPQRPLPLRQRPEGQALLPDISLARSRATSFLNSIHFLQLFSVV
jgi:hypothetical protein